MIKAIIIDDEPKSIKLLKNLLNRACPQVIVVGEASIPEEAFGLVNRENPELLFLDIDMPGTNGIELAGSFPDHSLVIIFVTAYDQFAMKAIRTNAVDYLLKPVNEKELAVAVMKAEKRITEIRILKGVKANSHSALNSISKIALPTNDGLTLVDINEIVRCQSDGSYTVFYTTGKQTFMVSYNIGEYEKQLKAFRFLRIHNSHLVNLNHIKRYKKGRGGTVIMSDGEEIDVSARKKEELMKELNLNGEY